MKILACLSAFALSLVAAGAHSIIPQPSSYEKGEGSFTLKSGAFLSASEETTAFYIDSIQSATGVKLKMAPADAGCAVQFLSGDMRGAKASSQKLTKGGYELRITPQCANIYADDPSGHFYGLQSLLQLLHGGKKSPEAVTIPCCTVKDTPRYGWRGYMLDESRHFSGVESVKRLLDAMAYYKMNRFHWHLTDSPGWRIEIKKYPKLTTVGGIGNHTDAKAEARFYTQKDVKEIVAYAKQRHIVVIPEIDMPGHAAAACRAYPQFSGGGSKKHPDFTFNPADPSTDAFLTDILKEVKKLFPDAGVIHFGGDEVHFGWQQWPNLPGVKKQLDQGAKLKDIETAFNRRFGKIINGLGYKTGGWDELASAGLDPQQTLIFWWRHNKPESLKFSLENGYDVVLCPRRPCYLDFVQHESHKSGRRWKGFNPLQDCYAFPESLKLPASPKGKVIGIQACLWTETTVTQARRDFMTFPRLLALAEAAWTPAKQKNFASFQTRLKPHLSQLKQRGLGFYDPFNNSLEIVK